VTFTGPSKVVEWTTVPLNVKDGVEHQAMELAYVKAENLHTRMWSLCKYLSLYSSCVITILGLQLLCLPSLHGLKHFFIYFLKRAK
jgi:hypothetical protein